LPCARRAGRNAGRWLEMERFVWWKHGVVYQIYPRSFMDADRDGVGDLRGIERRLDHLAWLGVDALWLSPCFRSPMADFGYDVSDYCDIDPIFGSLAGFHAPLAARRWPTSATTSPTTATSTRSSVRWRTSTRCWPPRTRAASGSCWIGFRTTPPTSIPGSWSRAPAAPRPSGTGTCGATRGPTVHSRHNGVA